MWENSFGGKKKCTLVVVIPKFSIPTDDFFFLNWTRENEVTTNISCYVSDDRGDAKLQKFNQLCHNMLPERSQPQPSTDQEVSLH